MAEKTQNNNAATQKTSAQAVPNSNAKPKFTCKDCSFTCNSHINFRVHLRSVHSIELPTENEKPQTPKKPTAVVIQKPPVVYQNPSQTTAGIMQKPPMIQKSPVPTAIVLQKPPMIQKSPVPTAIVLQKSTMAQKSFAPQTTAGTIQNNNQGNQNACFKAFPSQDLKSIYSFKNPAVGPKSLGTQNTAANIQGKIGNQNESSKAVLNPKALHLYTWKSPITVEKRPVPKTTAENIQNNNSNQNAAPNAAPKAALKPKVKSKFSCKDCNFSCNAIQNFKTHLLNVHGKTDENTQNSSTLKKEEKPKGKDAPTPKPDKPKRRASMFHQEVLFSTSGKDISKLKDYLSRTDREPLIGLEYVLEYRFKTKGNQIVTKYFCELCECDTDLDPMVEHLAGFRHRKQYLEREYPYVLKAQASNKEERSQFIRRMALEIEREEGTKMYMVDPSVWMETMMTLRTADKKMRKKTRWDDDRNDQNRMAKALKFLESFEVESELESTTVTRLCEKLKENLKMYQNKAKEDSLFPVRVARAQDVAMSLMQNAAKQRTHVQNLAQMNLKPKISIVLGKGQPTLPENTSRAFVSTFVPLNEQQGINRPLMPQSENQSDSSAKNLNQEDTQFFKRLMALLEALPQNASISESSEMNSKLLLLKSLLVNQKSEENERANQQLMKQVASMVQETISAQNASINQQLMMLMTSQNSTSMVMQTASLQNNLVQLSGNSVIGNAGLVPGMPSSGNMQMNMNSLMPFNQNLGSQVYGQMKETAPRPVDLDNYQVPRVEMPNYPSTSQKYDNLGYGTSKERNYLPKVDPFISQPDGIVTGGKNEQMAISKPNVGYEPRVYDKKWDDSYYDNPSVSEHRYVDRAGKQAPYTRVSLSPRNHYDSYDTRGEIGMEDPRQRPSLRAYGSSDWDDQDNDMRYTKRARLDTDNRADRSESYHNQSLEPLGMNAAGIPEGILNRIKGKDLFTASAIISEYSERRSGK